MALPLLNLLEVLLALDRLVVNLLLVTRKLVPISGYRVVGWRSW